MKIAIIGWLRKLNWWRRGDLNPRPSVRGLRLYMFSVVYLVNPYPPDGQGDLGELDNF